jgi:hypothetical protein
MLFGVNTFKKEMTFKNVFTISVTCKTVEPVIYTYSVQRKPFILEYCKNDILKSIPSLDILY